MTTLNNNCFCKSLAVVISVVSRDFCLIIFFFLLFLLPADCGCSPEKGYIDRERGRAYSEQRNVSFGLEYMIIEPAMCIYFQDSNSGVIDLPDIQPKY